MVPLLFSPDDTVSMVSSKNLKFWLVTPQDNFPLCMSKLFTCVCFLCAVTSTSTCLFFLIIASCFYFHTVLTCKWGSSSNKCSVSACYFFKQICYQLSFCTCNPRFNKYHPLDHKILVLDNISFLWSKPLVSPLAAASLWIWIACIHKGLRSLLQFPSTTFPSSLSLSLLSAVQILSFYLYWAWGNIYPGPVKQGGYEWASFQLVKLAAARCLLMSL